MCFFDKSVDCIKHLCYRTSAVATSVTVGGATCDVQTVIDTEITCTTNSAPSGNYLVDVNINGAGIALQVSTARCVFLLSSAPLFSVYLHNVDFSAIQFFHLSFLHSGFPHYNFAFFRSRCERLSVYVMLPSRTVSHRHVRFPHCVVIICLPRINEQYSLVFPQCVFDRPSTLLRFHLFLHFTVCSPFFLRFGICIYRSAV